MVIVVIRTRLRADADVAHYEQIGTRMDALVRAIPGFVSAKDFAAPDGDAISLVTFESAAALAAWRNLPEHLEAQRLGRERFYASYAVQVCEVVRAYDFTAPAGGGTLSA
jgi:heme-degrading monooxygenase HmoA